MTSTYEIREGMASGKGTCGVGNEMKTIEVNPKEDKTPRWAEMANLTSNLRDEAFIVQCACSGSGSGFVGLDPNGHVRISVAPSALII